MKSWSEFGFSRVSAVVPKLVLGKPLENAEIILDHFKKLSDEGSNVIFSPELSLTGYTCEDLFHSENLIKESEQAIAKIVHESKKYFGLWVVGTPFRLPDGRLINGACAINAGKILGIVPKIALPNMGEFYERRWFVTGRKINEVVNHELLGEILVSPYQIFASGPVRVGIEICQDLWIPDAPSQALALKGANLILNLSASNEITGKTIYRRELVGVQSEKLHCAYIYGSCNTDESTKDTVFSGHSLAFELGDCLAEVKPFEKNNYALTVDFDFEKILNSRTKDVCFLESIEGFNDSGIAKEYKISTFHPNRTPLSQLHREVSSEPFSDGTNFYEIYEIQIHGLITRVKSSKSKSLVIGISGGLDSTVALFVAEEVRDRLLKEGYPIRLVGVTMPGPGTSPQTLKIAGELLKLAKVDRTLEISITASVDQHLKDLGKTMDDRSVVFENAQARERTQILFDLANEEKGLVVGTGDLSEAALGWSTFNGDQMAHYGVNSGIPKTIIRKMLQWLREGALLAQTENIENKQMHMDLAHVLGEVIALPVSPELLPPKADGSIAQHTESLIGNYELHDFFIYHFLNSGFSKEKIAALAKVAFQDMPELQAKVDSTLEIFFQRFFSQQFKRSTFPPGPKVFKVSLSPRSDFRMPDELG